MLPRMENFKAAIFTKKVIAFNESFVPIGPKGCIKPLAIIWHEGIQGRKQEDLTSCFRAFFLHFKDIKKITIWLDNYCSAQNKNWCFLTFLIQIINSQEIDALEISLYYVQPVHSFMSADHFHHQVELAMKTMGKLYDYSDFEQCIKSANKCFVDAKVMRVEDFFDYKSECSVYKLNKNVVRPMLNDIVHIKAEKGLDYLMYSTTYDDYSPLQQLDFLKQSTLKKGIEQPLQKISPRGIHPSKKQSIIQVLLPLMPQIRRKFWLDFPTSETANDLYEEGD